MLKYVVQKSYAYQITKIVSFLELGSVLHVFLIGKIWYDGKLINLNQPKIGEITNYISKI